VEAAKFDFKPKFALGHEGYMWKQGDDDDDDDICDDMRMVSE